ncbi:MAG TPA: S9 family peptidase [Rickettsia endosymbiont of Proechinophthirus fluctus]|uniref:S9 family peptidase n=1 Tax=Rickettsia endosymbiont of Proechinophthirus fluctus TaxID=1462733 RepID=UPI000789E136|nr:S9 family peptidase [Rickettsia endosymbiont of Proechinophthirus fluctus]KYP98099.1 peptidase S9 [Rickettsia endosymbiont of Proechinophthirus fluctus]HJD54561.1 S9 family peptidase [Rickettsia endosymbiont of Proechinophthirus fluctus]
MSKIFYIIGTILIISVSIFMFQTITDNNQIIPRKVLFGNPDKARVSLTHDGKYILYVAPKDDVLNIWLAPSDDISKAEAITHDKGRGIWSYAKAYNNKNILYTQDFNGDENDRIYSYNIETKETKLLTPAKGVKAKIAGASHKKPNEILIYLNERNPEYFDIYKLNLDTLEKELIYKNDRFTDYVTDANLNLRFGSLLDKDGAVEYYELKDGEPKLFTKISMEDSFNTAILGFDASGETLYMLEGRNRNTSALKAITLATGSEEILAEDAKADIGLFTVHPTKQTPQAVYIDYDRVSYKILDKDIEDDIKYLQSIDRGDLIINSRTLDDKTWIVAYMADNTPVKYYKYDRTNKKAEFLFTNRKELEQYNLAKMIPIIIKSRDGLDLVSYITFPNDVKLNKNNIPDRKVPLILNVHGGPWVRDSWGYNPEHQWLANRGYAVLSINYRGSTGFGKDFLNAGNLEYAGKMHTDLIDGVNWAIKNNIVDSDKVCIMGGSYGGYATLVGLTMTPDVFACGIDVVGMSNLLTHVQSKAPYITPLLSIYKTRIGPWDTEEEKEFLRQRSPINFVDNIKKPLFIAQGVHDVRVVQAESEQIVNSMQAKHIPIVYALYKDEGHGFAKAGNRISYYALAEQFLAKVLKGRAEHIGDDLKNANLILNDKEKISGTEAEKIIDTAVGN